MLHVSSPDKENILKPHSTAKKKQNPAFTNIHKPGGHKEMSSILGDQIAPSYMGGGGGGCRVSAKEYSCAQIHIEPK